MNASSSRVSRSNSAGGFASSAARKCRSASGASPMPFAATPHQYSASARFANAGKRRESSSSDRSAARYSFLRSSSIARA